MVSLQAVNLQLVFFPPTQVEVALQPALLRHRHDGHQVGPQAPAGLPGVEPGLLLVERFVAEVPELVPVGPWTPQLWRRTVAVGEGSARSIYSEKGSYKKRFISPPSAKVYDSAS